MGNYYYNCDKNEQINRDKNISADLNIYVCGNINTFSNEEDEFYLFDMTAWRNNNVLDQIFDKIDKTNNGSIQLNDSNNIQYQYKFRQKIKDNKIYNAFLFLNKADEKFLDFLFEHLYEIDIKNENKNVILFYGEDMK